MKYIILVLLILPTFSKAQLKVSGLGSYIVDVTTPDSVNRIDFEEQEQAYVKGTLTLPCTHIRRFRASKTEIGGIPISNLFLFFYDNRLFKISCDYSDELQEAFILKHGKGASRPRSRFIVCAQQTDKPMLIWGEDWQNGTILALAVHTNGYNADCLPEESVKLMIVSQQVSALSSDCDLQDANPFMEEFDK